MSKVEILTPSKHAELKYASSVHFQGCAELGSIMIVPYEFIEVQREYPIVFRKDPESGQFLANAMLGLILNQNLYVNDGQWLGSYIPLAIARGPFMIGSQNQLVNGESQPTSVICANLDDPSLSQGQGEALFDSGGQTSEQLKAISRALGELQAGLELGSEMTKAFIEFDLLEPMKLDIELKNGEKMSIAGVYTVSDDKLSNLPAEALHYLNQKGYLRMAFAVVNSVNNVQKLIDMKNASL